MLAPLVHIRKRFILLCDVITFLFSDDIMLLNYFQNICNYNHTCQLFPYTDHDVHYSIYYKGASVTLPHMCLFMSKYFLKIIFPCIPLKIAMLAAICHLFFYVLWFLFSRFLKCVNIVRCFGFARTKFHFLN